MESWAKMMERVSSNAYLYYFSHLPPGSEVAFHAAELSYVFNNEKYSVRFSPNMPADPPRKSDLALANIMSDYWVAFAKTGVPIVSKLPEWKPYSKAAKYYMEFKEGDAHLKKNLFPGAWQLQDKIKKAWRYRK